MSIYTKRCAKRASVGASVVTPIDLQSLFSGNVMIESRNYLDQKKQIRDTLAENISLISYVCLTLLREENLFTINFQAK
nr:unnamed protein product [Callosobruchus analis]